MNRGEKVVRKDIIGKKDRILVVVEVKRNEREEKVEEKRKIEKISGREIRDNIKIMDEIKEEKERKMIDEGGMVWKMEIMKKVDIEERIGRIEILSGEDKDKSWIKMIEDKEEERWNGWKRVERKDRLNESEEKRRLRKKERKRMKMNVRENEREVGVVVLKERNERWRKRKKMIWRKVNKVKVLKRRNNKIEGMKEDEEIVKEKEMIVKIKIRMGERVIGLLNRRKVKEIISKIEIEKIEIRDLDEEIFVEEGKGWKRVDKKDIRELRSLNREDKEIMGRMKVEELKERKIEGKKER